MKYLFTILILLFVSCSKNSNKYCWECDVTCGVTNPNTEKREVCLDDYDDVPHFGPDANGNDCNSFCRRK